MKLCVYAICKNESKFVKQWLDNMSEADYIVVLDTGSTDGTYKMLKEDPRVTRVEREVIKPWRFDVARNKSMELIPEDTDLCVCTDFDELFEPGWAQVIRDNYRPEIDRMFYTFAWSHNSIGEPTDIFRYDKIHKPGLYKWIYPVHEVLWFNETDKRNQIAVNLGTNVFLHHYPDKTKERKYYFDLLELSRQENPTDCHVQMLYAREWLIKKNLDRALEEYLKCLNMPEISEPHRREVLLHSLLTVATIYEDKRNYDEAIWYCHEFIKEDPTFREPYLVLSEIYNNMNIPTLAEACAEKALEYGYQHSSWVEKANTYTGWTEDALSVAQSKLEKFGPALNNVEKALQHNPEDVRLIKNENYILKGLLNQLKQNEEILNKVKNNKESS